MISDPELLLGSLLSTSRTHMSSSHQSDLPLIPPNAFNVHFPPHQSHSPPFALTPQYHPPAAANITAENLTAENLTLPSTSLPYPLIDTIPSRPVPMQYCHISNPMSERSSNEVPSRVRTEPSPPFPSAEQLHINLSHPFRLPPALSNIVYQQSRLSHILSPTLTLTSSPSSEKRLARAIRNRESARRSRMKSKLHMESLETAIASISSENAILRSRIHALLPLFLQRSPWLRKQLQILFVELGCLNTNAPLSALHPG